MKARIIVHAGMIGKAAINIIAAQINGSVIVLSTDNVHTKPTQEAKIIPLFKQHPELNHKRH